MIGRCKMAEERPSGVTIYAVIPWIVIVVTMITIL